MRLTLDWTDGKRLTVVEKSGDDIPTYSIEAQAMLDNYANLGVALTGNMLNRMVLYVDELVAGGQYLNMDANYMLFLGAVNEINGLIDWKGGKVATNHGAIFGIGGATFNGAEWIDTGFNPTTQGITVHNTLFGVYMKENKAVGVEIIMGADGSDWELRADLNSFRTNQISANIEFGDTYKDNHLYIATQDALDNRPFYVDGIEVVSDNAVRAEIFPNANVSLGSRNFGSFPWHGTMSTFIAGRPIGFDQVGYNIILRNLLTGVGAI